MLPTYQALKGICESVYWKPSIIWYVDSVKILKPIRTESKGIRPIKYGGGNDLAYYTYLSDVSYIVTAHFEFNRHREDLQRDWNQNKHYFIVKRCIDKGGRRDIFLGARECQGYVESVENEESGYYDNIGEMDFGLQYHSLSYPDENGTENLIAKFWCPKMENGIILFCRPEKCPKEVIVKKMPMKTFDQKNFVGLDEDMLLQGYFEQEGDK